ncbi:MAG: hypothetical protein DMG31_19345 [Acidobacteria bacterium]|nr:MAG: hypothetical protein DMG31_19345 [Acidobacteriota bacterium]
MVSHLIMRVCWRLILPTLGLILFSAESFDSFQLNRQHKTSPQKYYYWASLALDSDPLNRHFGQTSPGDRWQLRSAWIDPGYLTQALMLSALPAFVLGALIVSALAHLGVSEVLSFTVAMPLLVFGWFYFVGGRIDQWIRKRSRPAARLR